MSRIAVIGTGYVGLTTGACFAHLGHDVVCADLIADKVERLSRGDVPILEAGLDELVRNGLDSGRLSFVLGAEPAARDCEFAYLCVPTPQGDDGSADLTYIRVAAESIGPVLPSESVVVNKSTVPVGSTRVVEQALGRDDVRVVSNPEFLREGSAVHDFLNPDRIVIGAEDPETAGRVAALFSALNAPVIVTDPASAETIKYASNAFLATKVSFVNAIANVCEVVGADVREVVLGMGYDKRIGFEFLKPGPGWGGSCFAGDETVLVRRAGGVRLLTFAALFGEVDRLGPYGYEVLSWRPEDPSPEFLPVASFSSRHFRGDAIEVRTKLGRRVVCTPDHPFVVGDGIEPMPVGVKLAADLTVADWLPVAQHGPLLDDVPDVVEGASVHTADRLSADKIMRQLGAMGRMAELRHSVSKNDTECRILASADPDDYRPLLKNASWVRVAGITPAPYDGPVYSVEVPDAHTVVTTSGLVAHNCFPKDSRALVHIAEEAGYDFGLLRGVIGVNDAQFERVADKVERLTGGSLAGRTIAVWGLTFKARTDDMRDSPSLSVIERLLRRGARVQAYDPAVTSLPDGVGVDIEVCADPYSACEGAAVLTVLTEWDDFRWYDFDKVAAALEAPRIVDGRNLLDPAKLRRRGFEYVGVGR